MNLERVEELCLAYLAQSPQAVVPLELLLRHCQREEGLEKLGREELLDFLRRHNELTVLEGLDEQPGLDMSLFTGMEGTLGPRVVLNTRIPTRKEMMLMLVQQLDHLKLVLNQSLSEAQQTGDSESAAKVREALDRTQQLRQQFERLLK